MRTYNQVPSLDFRRLRHGSYKQLLSRVVNRALEVQNQLVQNYRGRFMSSIFAPPLEG